MENSSQAILYKINFLPDTEAIITVYKEAGINRPIVDSARITKMYLNSNLIISAWHNDVLVGISRSITDFSYCCYLSDLAVKLDYQKRGIGEKLILLTREELGDTVSLILQSAESAMDYYPKLGFNKIANGFIIPRKW